MKRIYTNITRLKLEHAQGDLLALRAEGEEGMVHVVQNGP